MYMENIRDELFSSPTTGRHNLIVGGLKTEIHLAVRNAVKSGKAFVFTDTVALVYYGSVKNPLDYSMRKLVDVREIGDLTGFTEKVINKLDYVEPDLMLFNDSTFVVNKDGTRYAGVPDLIVEVWSESNTDLHKQVKFDLYSASPDLEHWYIEQDSPVIRCFMGKSELAQQDLTGPVATQRGIAIDVGYLAPVV